MRIDVSGRSSTATICIDCLHPASTRADINPTAAELRFLWAVSVEQSATSLVWLQSALNTFKQKLKTHLFGRWQTSPGAAVALLWFLAQWHKSSDWLTYLLTYLRSPMMLQIDRSRMSHYQWWIATVPLITKRALGRVHVPPTKLFWRLTVNKTVVKPRVAAAASGLYSGLGSKVNQFVHVPTSVDTQHFNQIHARIFE